MPDSEKREILTRLDDGRKALIAALAGVDDQMAQWKQTPEAWSILECVEHVALAEELLLLRLAAARAAASVPPNPAREDMILKRGIDRTTRVESPEAARPSGRYRQLQDAVAAFSAVRERTIDWLARQEEDLRSRLADHPLIPVPVSCYEMLLILSVHPRRHADQIQAIRKSLEREPENQASRQELAALIARLDEPSFQRAVGTGWTVSTLLCHLAFWDRLANFRLTEWESGQVETSRLGAHSIDSINAAVKAISLAVPGPAAARLALDSAAAVDSRIEGIAPELRGRIIHAGFERLLRRSLHRREHLRKIEEALG